MKYYKTGTLSIKEVENSKIGLSGYGLVKIIKTSDKNPHLKTIKVDGELKDIFVIPVNVYIDDYKLHPNYYKALIIKRLTDGDTVLYRTRNNYASLKIEEHEIEACLPPSVSRRKRRKTSETNPFFKNGYFNLNFIPGFNYITGYELETW